MFKALNPDMVKGNCEVVAGECCLEGLVQHENEKRRRARQIISR
jgi:hypothetical protein